MSITNVYPAICIAINYHQRDIGSGLDLERGYVSPLVAHRIASIPASFNHLAMNCMGIWRLLCRENDLGKYLQFIRRCGPESYLRG